MTVILEHSSSLAKHAHGIALIGGTFDPIHKGHLQCANEVADCFNLQKVKFIPSAQPPHGKIPRLSAENRCKLVEIAIKNSPRFEIDLRECQREGLSYTIDTLISVREEYNDLTPIIFIMGADAFAKINDWHDWQKLLNFAHIVIINRPEYDLPTSGIVADFMHLHETKDAKEILKRASGKIYCHEMPAINISSSDIRQRLTNNEDTSNLLPKEVLAMISKANYYSTVIPS